MTTTLIISIVVAATAIMTLIFRELQQRKENLDKKVNLAVDAKLGDQFVKVRQIENEVHAKFEEQVKGATAQLDEVSRNGAEVISEIERHLDTLAERASVTERLDSLLKRADEIVPRLESQQEVIPASLISSMSEAEPQELRRLLLQLLQHKATSAEQLEYGGDQARQRLEDPDLARRLYKASVDKGPGRLSARAEFLALLISSGEVEESRAAFEELTQLANENINHETVIPRLLDSFIERSDFDGLEEFVLSVLDRRPRSKKVIAYLTRNLAIAGDQLGRDPSEVTSRYSAAVDSARNTGDSNVLVNVMRPYVRYLFRSGDFDEAEKVTTEALYEDPTEAQLYLSLAEAKKKRRKYEFAARCFALAYKYGNATEETFAQIGMRDLSARVELDHLINGESVGGSTTALPEGVGDDQDESSRLVDLLMRRPDEEAGEAPADVNAQNT